MVRGESMAVTAVPAMYQCAEIESTARGRGSFAPSAAQPRVQAFVCSAFIGLPCPRNSAGSLARGSGTGAWCSGRGEQLDGRLIEPRAQRKALAGAGHVTDRDLHPA